MNEGMLPNVGFLLEKHSTIVLNDILYQLMKADVFLNKYYIHTC